MAKQIIFILMLLLSSCQDTNEIKNFLDKLEKSNFCTEYSGYSTTIIASRGLRFVAKDSASHFFFGRSFGYIEPLENKNFDRELLDELLNKLEELNIISFESNSEYCLIYTTHTDSTYQDIKKYNPTYTDKNLDDYPECIESDCPYNLVFIHTSDINKLPFYIKGEYTIHRFRDNWFYFRSYQFHKYSRF